MRPVVKWSGITFPIPHPRAKLGRHLRWPLSAVMGGYANLYAAIIPDKTALSRRCACREQCRALLFVAICRNCQPNRRRWCTMPTIFGRRRRSHNK